MLGSFLQSLTPAEMVLLFTGFWGSVSLLIGLHYRFGSTKGRFISLSRASSRVYLNKHTSYYGHRFFGTCMLVIAALQLCVLLPLGWLSVMGAGNVGEEAENTLVIYILASSGLILLTGIFFPIQMRRMFDKEGNPKRPIPRMFQWKR